MECQLEAIPLNEYKNTSFISHKDNSPIDHNIASPSSISSSSISISPLTMTTTTTTSSPLVTTGCCWDQLSLKIN
ncbi:unnamed protein product, partial [Trichobilharzia regenti]